MTMILNLFTSKLEQLPTAFIFHLLGVKFQLYYKHCQEHFLQLRTKRWNKISWSVCYFIVYLFPVHERYTV